ncbi:MAG TPA: hypothetical protein VEI46_07105 [Thermodesulfovibrionales bacterium]|nr:hypothetical protein [Thermodesulfovibrionales bacterium]
MPRAIALLSGGLDSTLAILVMLQQGIEVTAVTFLNHFGCDVSDRSSCSRNPFPAAEQFGFRVKLCHLSSQFIDIVKNPRFGYGKNMNPCIDCRILMLREAKELMELIGADFVVTGEVIGQRPMSQKKNTLAMIDKVAGVKGYVLRPLSAKLMPVTVPEEKGLVRREKLYDFSGRSRKPQIVLAREFGLTDYPAPAGGCLLTEPNYSYRLRELLSHTSAPSLNDLHLLRLGRHFRFSPRCKAIVGRDEKENSALESFGDEESYLLWVEDAGSPTALLSGQGAGDFVPFAASLCARYSDARHLPEVEVTVVKGGNQLDVRNHELALNTPHGPQVADHVFRIRVSPAGSDLVERYRIEKPNTKNRNAFSGTRDE